MSVLIKGMEMPKNCANCPLYWNECEYITKYIIKYSDRRGDERPEHCPLVEVKEPHGRLVDLDKMIDDYWDGGRMELNEYAVDQMHAVIEAEGSD